MEQKRISIAYPTYLLQTMSEEQISRLAREAFLVRLYERGLISSGQAGEILGIARSDFLDLLGLYGISYFDADTDLTADLRNAHRAGASDVADSTPPVRG